MATPEPQKPIHDYAAFLQQRYAAAVYRVPLDLGLGCPNRDAGQPGCTFCAENGSRAPYLDSGMPLAEQVRLGIARARERYHANAFLAYVQAFTATHAPAAVLEELLTQVLQAAEFAGLIIATRPDCLPEPILAVLAQLATRIDTWVELGVQSTNPHTLLRLRRGHDVQSVVTAAKNLAARGIQVAPHVILGLPGESSAHMRRTAADLARLPFAAIKIHNLHVLAGSALAEAWRRGQVPTWDEHEYGEFLMDFLRRIPYAWPVMRLSTDSPRHLLLAPRWWMSKEDFKQYIERQMRERGWQQGDLCPGSESHSALTPPLPAAARNRSRTADAPSPKAAGSTKHQTQRLQVLAPSTRETQALRALLDGARLPALQGSGRCVVLAVGFAQGTLALEAIRLLPQVYTGSLRMIGLGCERTVLSDLQQRHPDDATLLESLRLHRSAHFQWGSIKAYWGDPRRYLFRIRGQADLVLLEPADIDRNIEFYTLDFLRRLVRLLTPEGVLLSAATGMPFRGALDRLGLHLGGTPGGSLRGNGTLASWSADVIETLLDAEEESLFRDTLAGIPYRDYPLTWSRDQIIQHRDAVLRRLRRRGWPEYRPHLHRDTHS